VTHGGWYCSSCKTGGSTEDGSAEDHAEWHQDQNQDKCRKALELIQERYRLWAVNDLSDLELIHEVFVITNSILKTP
jgi:hypothetical protein